MSAQMEDLIDETGGCGVFQILHVISTHMSRVVATFGINMMSFGNYDPGWACVDPFSNGSSLKAVRMDHFGNCSSLPQCSDIEFSAHGKTIVTEWNLICGNAWIPPLITSLQMIGQMIGSIIAGYTCDNFGRKVSMYGTTFIFAVANLLAGFSPNWQMFGVWRFFIGVGIGGINSAGLIYTMEFLNSKWRGIVGGLPIINTGLLVLSLIVYLERDWRMVQFTIAGSSFAAMLALLWISESPRWLAVNGKEAKAKRIVSRIARYNKTPVPNMDAIDEMSKLCKKTNTKTTNSYLDLFREKKIRKITIQLCLLRFCDIVANTSMAFSLKSFPGDFYINFIMFSASEIPAVMVTGTIINRFGRVRGGAAYFGIAAIACGGAAVVLWSKISSKFGLAVVILAMTAKGLLAGGRSVVRVVAGELTPTSVRALGYSFQLTVSRSGAVIASYLVPGPTISLHAILIVQTVVLLCSALLFLTLPETKDKAMEDRIETGGDSGEETKLKSGSSPHLYNKITDETKGIISSFNKLDKN